MSKFISTKISLVRFTSHPFLWFQFFFTLGSSQSCQTSVFTWKASFYCCLLWINVCNTLHGHDCKLCCLFNKKIISLLNIDKSIINRLSKSIILMCLHWSSNIDEISFLSHSSRFVFKYLQTDIIPIRLSGEEYIVDSSLCFGPNSCPSMVSLVQILFWAMGLQWSTLCRRLNKVKTNDGVYSETYGK